MNQRRGEYTPIQISFDLGSPVHREALFQVLLTMEQEVPESTYDEGLGETIVPCVCDDPEPADVEPVAPEYRSC